MTAATRRARVAALSGRRAGIVSRLVAAGLDLVITVGILFLAMFSFAIVRYLLGLGEFRLPQPSEVFTAVALLIVQFFYLTSSWTGNGRTIGDRVVGLRVMRSTGAPLEHWRAGVRALVCIFLGGISLLWVVVSRRNEALHDIVFRTAVVHDWSD